MSENNTYNGWCNWATWNVALWVDNDEGLYRWRLDTLGENPDEAETKAFCREVFPEGKTPDDALFEDVDFQELAEHWQGE